MKKDIKEILYYFKKYHFEDTMIDGKECKLLYDYITNLQEENEYNNFCNEKLREKITNLEYKITTYENHKSRNEKAIEYITSYESISTIQGLDKIEQNKTLDEKTIIVMVNRYLEVHDKLLNILNGGDFNE